jgi:hypothetical protein
MLEDGTGIHLNLTEAMRYYQLAEEPGVDVKAPYERTLGKVVQEHLKRQKKTETSSAKNVPDDAESKAKAAPEGGGSAASATPEPRAPEDGAPGESL